MEENVGSRDLRYRSSVVRNRTAFTNIYLRFLYGDDMYHVLGWGGGLLLPLPIFPLFIDEIVRRPVSVPTDVH